MVLLAVLALVTSQSHILDCQCTVDRTASVSRVSLSLRARKGVTGPVQVVIKDPSHVLAKKPLRFTLRPETGTNTFVLNVHEGTAIPPTLVVTTQPSADPDQMTVQIR